MNWTLVAIIFCGVCAMSCAGVGMWLSIQNRRYHHAALAAIEGLGETHMQALNVCMMEIDRLKIHLGIKLEGRA